MTDKPSRVEFYRHAVRDEDIEAVTQVLRSIFLTTGPVTGTFEQKFAAHMGARHAVGVTSCTAGLFLSLKALGIGPGDEVITTPMTFIATANTILHTGATPVFVDVEADTGNLDVTRVEAAITPRTKAVMPVHLYGHMVDMKALAAICEPRQLSIIEDCAHAVESERDGVRPGQLGTTANFSFYATKNLTSGEGGAVTTNDDHINDQLRLLRQHGMSKNAADRYTKRYQHYDMELLGYKYNLPDVLAALMVHQIDRLGEQLERREALCQRYERGFQDVERVNFPIVQPNNTSARHLFTIWVPGEHRDDTIAALQDDGIGVAVNYRALHLMRYYRETMGFTPGTFPEAERIGNQTITLPLYPDMKDEQVDRVIDAIRTIAATW